MTQTNQTLILATGNAGKLRELRELFGEIPHELRSLRDFAGIRDVEETGSTFEENALLKARGFASQTGVMSLADDSGLEVEVLGNAPGVLSARFAGRESGYDVKIAELLRKIDETGDDRRRARFVCVMAICDPEGKVINISRGVCNGTIAPSPRGDRGFGYDPIFIPDGYDRTFGELGDDVKRRISHRAQAAQLIIRYLLDFTDV
jgi:non-canonical purine NTP pyrophosphatase (RdgB/HAM1 family)